MPIDTVTKELLEKKEGEGATEEGKEGGENTGEEAGDATKTETEGKNKGNVFLDSLRSVASHVPSIFKGNFDYFTLFTLH